MFIHKPTGQAFENRKQAIILMGHARYNKFLRQGDFIFINDPEHTDKKKPTTPTKG